MKHRVLKILMIVTAILCCACAPQVTQPDIVATTMPVYTFTSALCQGTPLTVGQLVQENISCLHDYTLTVRHMKMLENADLIVINGAGLEAFIEDAIPDGKVVIEASKNVELHHSESSHHDEDHHHEEDPHIWLSISSAKQMAYTICEALTAAYPKYAEQFDININALNRSFDELSIYATAQLSQLNCRDLITFHDGFSYMAEEFDLHILHSVEEESGSEASAMDLIKICNLIETNSIPAIFTETNGSDSAAKVICEETGAKLFCLDMALSGDDYFQAMYHNINTLKEALG